MSVVRRQDVQRSCAICHRTLLLGERAMRFTPGGDNWVDVCALCTATADEHGWIKEGSPTTPIVAERGRRRRFGGLAALLEPKKVEPEQKVSEPMLRRLNPEEQAIVEAAELFNDSAYRRTIAGIAKSLGDARVSLLPLSGVNHEVVITDRLGHLLVPVPRPLRIRPAGATRRARLRAGRPQPPLRALERAPRPRRPGDPRHPEALVKDGRCR